MKAVKWIRVSSQLTNYGQKSPMINKEETGMFKSINAVIDEQMARMDWYGANRVNWCANNSIRLNEEWLDHVDEDRLNAMGTSSWLEGINLI